MTGASASGSVASVRMCFSSSLRSIHTFLPSMYCTAARSPAPVPCSLQEEYEKVQRAKKRCAHAEHAGVLKQAMPSGHPPLGTFDLLIQAVKHDFLPLGLLPRLCSGEGVQSDW